MYHVTEIKSINAHAAAVAEEKARRARGLKPKGKVGQVLRAVANAACHRG